MTQRASVILIDDQAVRRAEWAAILQPQYVIAEFTHCEAAQAATTSDAACVIVAGNAALENTDTARDKLLACAPVVAVFDTAAGAKDALSRGFFEGLVAGDLPPHRLLHAVARAAETAELRRTVAQQALSLEQGRKEMQEFAYAISHDLQEPIRSVIGFCGLLEKETEEVLSDRGRRFLNIIVRSGYRGKQMIEDLLRYSRVESRGGEFATTSARKCLDDASLGLKETVTATGALITCGELPPIYADYWQIVTLFEELLGNAMKFCGEATPTINIQAQTNGDLVEFRMADNGIGIETRFQEDVFKVFRRLHTIEEYPGTGIGLPLCKRIVKRHGGEMRIDASGEMGAIVYFELPVSRAEGSREQTS